MTQLDNIIERKKPVQKSQIIFQSGDELRSIYALRSGTLKSYTLSENGEEQITAFHLPGDLIGFDAIMNMKHVGFAQALETAMICEIPFDILDDLAGKMPKIRHQISKMSAEEKLAAFLHNLSQRYAARGFSAREFRLTMTRGDIGNYLGLTIETISRLLGRFQKSGMITVQGKYITINQMDVLADMATGIKNQILVKDVSNVG